MNIRSTTQAPKHNPMSQAMLARFSSSGEDKIGEALDKLTLSAFTMGNSALDIGMSMGYLGNADNAVFEKAGLFVGGAHVAFGIGNWVAAANAADNRDTTLAKHRVTNGLGHLLSGIGHISGAMGAGAWALAPLVGGITVRAMEDFRTRN